MKYIKLLIIVMLFAIAFAGCTAQGEKTVDISRYFTKYETKYLDGKSFIFEIQDAGSIAEKLKMGHSATEFNSASGQERQARAEEWGYSLTHLDGIKDGMGREIISTFKNISDREDAVEKIFEYLDNQYKAKSISKVYYSMNGHYPWHHYAGENGFDVLGSEIGENINNYQWHIALNRGAAKQYDKPWFVDFSMWHIGFTPETTVNTEDGSMPTGGHSMNLFERSMIMSYMSGAGSLVAEGGDRFCFDDDGDVTVYGKSCIKMQSFFTENPDIGNAYVPFGIVLDYYHGTYFGVGEKLAFNTFPYDKGDMMTDKLINHIWEGGIEIGQDESGTLVNNGKGDLYDVLLQNAPPDVLAMYPCLILSGSISFSDEQVGNYYEYVNNGGTLLVNSAYLNDLSEYASYKRNVFIPCGNGRVFVYGSDYSISRLKNILKQLTDEFVPFSFNKDVEYIINFDTQENALFLTLINNNGITKLCNEAPVVDERKTVNLTVTYRGAQQPSGAEDIYGDSLVGVDGNKMKLTLAPGGIAVIKMSF